jgi:hypothetical protein
MADIDPKTADKLVSHGEHLLEMFHEDYACNHVGATTEFYRGMVTAWRQILNLLYGERVAEELVLRVRASTKLSVPPAGPLSEDGTGYMGFDSGSDGGFIGKID